MAQQNSLHSVDVRPEIPAAVAVAPAADLVAGVTEQFDIDAALKLWSQAQTASIFNHPVWWRAACDCYGADRRLHAVSVRAGGELCGYWLFWEKRLGAKDAFARVLEPVGARLTDYVMPLVRHGYDRKSVIGAMLDALKPRLTPDAILLWSKADRISTADGAVGQAFLAGEYLVRRNVRRCPRMTLPGSYEELKSRWSRNHRSQLRRRKRRLSEIGDLSFHVAATRGEVRGGLQQMFDLHRTNWNERGGGSEFDDPANVAFIERIASDLPFELLHYSEVRVGARPVSCNLDFRLDDEILFYKGAFDLELSAFSPGMVHFAMVAEWAIENGIAVLDFMQGEENYKYQWADGVRETVSHAIARPAGFPVWYWNTKIRNLVIEYRI